MFMDHSKKLDEIKKKQYYRENVIKRNNEIVEEKKNKTLWRLEKIDLKAVREISANSPD